MRAELSTSLLEAVLARTLAEAAFVFLERSDEPPELDQPVLEATLSYAGEREGELRLALSEGFASALASNMLGEDEGGAAVTGDDEDAVGELLNMVAGALALEVFGREARCALGIPRVQRVAAAAHRRALETAGAAVTMVDEEGRRIDLSSSAPGNARP
jgi:CheY-specific phosphatase CheX